MEGVAASRYTIKVDTANGRVEIATTSYGRGGNAIANVGLFTTSNVVVGAGNANVIYATGTIVTNNIIVAGSALTPPSTGYAFLADNQTFTGINFFTGETNLGQALIASGTFTTTSTMTLTFPALSAGLYRLGVGVIKDGTAAVVSLRFNNVPGAAYYSANNFTGSDGITGNDSGAAITGCYLGRSGVNHSANGIGTAELTFMVNPNDTTTLGGSGQVMQQTAATTFYQVGTVCRYGGVATVTQANVTSTSGNMEGYMHLVRVR